MLHEEAGKQAKGCQTGEYAPHQLEGLRKCVPNLVPQRLL
jgi:hypothetical protein